MPKFEESLQRLEKIVDELEKGELPLEKALGLFEEGIALSASCRKELEAAEGKVEILLKQNGKLQPEPFEAKGERLQEVNAFRKHACGQQPQHGYGPVLA